MNEMRHVAYHEAGHAIAARAMGCWCVKGWIAPHPSGGWHGMVSMEHLDPWPKLVAVMAGVEAERMQFRRKAKWSEKDATNADDLADELVQTRGDDRVLWIKRARLTARAILDSKRDELDREARRLIRAVKKQDKQTWRRSPGQRMMMMA